MAYNGPILKVLKLRSYRPTETIRGKRVFIGDTCIIESAPIVYFYSILINHGASPVRLGSFGSTYFELLAPCRSCQ